MRTISLVQPRKILFGQECTQQCADDILALGLERVFVVTSPPILNLVKRLTEPLMQGGVSAAVFSEIATEPGTTDFEMALAAARAVEPEAVVGFGGGSAMDVAKVVAALYDGKQDVGEIFGIGQVNSRALHLFCIPTTAGTGSEVSPNSILFDEVEGLKKGITSPHLVPDAAYIDPLLTITMPPALTAATGLDALTHCIEVYANRVAHPLVDLYALEGIRLIGANLLLAVQNGEDVVARTSMALGSLCGGLGLGPVNTAAVHALAYPLGSEFHVAHGLSNALLLPHVLRFNIPAAPERYAEVAKALGANPGDSSLETAHRGADRISDLLQECGTPVRLRELDVPESAIPEMAKSAITITRLLRNNLRELTVYDAEAIYRAAY